MENKIIILSQELVDKIAAGEVVERPASVVKELVENSIDAGAQNISVEIKKGGIKYIRVTDDGMGMRESEAALAFQRHATSKIKRVDDLFQISTLGFRGEALPSIASVSLLDIITRTSEELSGTRFKIEGGMVKERKQMGAAVGTSIVVRELFYNVPARRKFLKTVLTETRHIIDLLTKLAIAYPELSFKLESDQRELFGFAKIKDPKGRLADVFGKNRMEKMIQIEESEEEPKVRGFLGKPEIARSNRAELYLFVNRRPITSRSLHHAVQTGYGELLPKGKFPFAIVFIQVDPKLVDVNVHPTKNEVRFADDRGMHDLVYRKIKESLASFQVIPDFKMTERRAMSSYDAGSVKTVTQKKDDSRPKMPQPSILPFSNSISKSEEELPQGNFLSDTQEKLSPGLNLDRVVEKKEDKDTTEVKTSAPEATNFWQLADTYILSRVRGNLMVLDQHAAHERILYEAALRNFDQKNACSQQVLFPQVQELSPKEFQILDEHKGLIQKLGFEIKNFGGRAILVTAVPAFIRNKSGEVFLREILTQLEEERKEEKNRLKAVAKSFACHGAIKAGEKLTQEEMQNLVHQLFATEEPYSCPHGRPTVIKLSLEELNKKFGRS